MLLTKLVLNGMLSQCLAMGGKNPEILGHQAFLPQLTQPREYQLIPIIPLTILAFHLHLPSHLFIKKSSQCNNFCMLRDLCEL